MSNKIKNNILLHSNVIKKVFYIISIPFGLRIANLLGKSLFNLGTYTGTFLRFLYDIVVY